MSPDEHAVCVVSFFLAVILWGRFYWLAAATLPGARGRSGRTALLLAPAIALIACELILITLAARDVRNSPTYLGFYSVVAAAWLSLFTSVLTLSGISPRDDVFERSNRAAGWACTGAILGAAFCFAGGNVGDGPGWWVVLFSAALATFALFVLWLIVELFAGFSESITVDRDDGAGLRLAGALAGLGLILGRAVSGDWRSAEATIEDFVNGGWPALVLSAAVVIMERSYQSSAGRRSPNILVQGLVPALSYVGSAAIYLAIIRVRP